MRALKVLFMTTVLMAAAAAADVRVQLHLKRVAPEGQLERELEKRSTPGSPLYRQHMSVEQLTRLVRPVPGALEGAQQFLKAPGVQHERVFSTQDAVAAVVSPTSPVAAALGLTGKMFEPSDVRKSVAVPAALRAYVDRIVVVPPAATKGGAGAQRRKLRQRAGDKKAAGPKPDLQFPGTLQTPETIYARYAIPTASVSGAQGVAEFQQSYFNPEWINTFSTTYGLPAPNIQVSGPNSPSQDDLEGVLDLEYITALAPGATTWWVSSNDTSTDPFGIDFAWMCDQIKKLSPMPLVVSISWGIPETQYVQAGAIDVLKNDDEAFMKLGLLGVSILAASGDSGPGSRGVTSCSRFDPSWPASAPHVTTVGATYSTGASAPETSVSFSGGGFSDVFPTQSWQKSAVQAYLTSSSVSLPKATFFNATGRAFPDVSALGTNFNVYGKNQLGQLGFEPVSGTSCAAPTFAAVLTRVNAALAAKKQNSLGFINPTIYSLGKVGQDVTAGASVDTECFGLSQPGFPATTGWDPVSGLGTPNYPYLEANL